MIRAGFGWALVAAIALFMLTGCAERPNYARGFMASEVAFHTLNVLDQAQSIHAISHDCFREVNPVTRALLGDKPSSGEFAAYGLALSVAFHYVNRLDYVQDRPALRGVITGLAIAAKGYAVAHNHAIGMRVSGTNPGCSP